MKRILLTTIVISCSFAAFGQGFVNFENFNTESTVDFGTPHFTPAPLGNPGFTVALLWYNGTSFQNIDTFQSSTANVGGVFGCFIAGTVTVPIFTSTGTFEIQAWYNTVANYTTYAAAVAAATGTTYAGITGSFTATETQNPASPGFQNGWSGNVSMTPVPEPGTIALGALVGAVLLLFRRRK